MIRTIEELNRRICTCTDALENGKYHDETGGRHVLLCGGTGCLSSNSQEIYEKFCRLVEEAGLSDRVTVLRKGRYVGTIDTASTTKEELSRITEPFYMIDKSRSRAQNGAGLGLALGARIAELHNTKLEYDSEVGKGTTVRILLKGGAADEQAE